MLENKPLLRAPPVSARRPIPTHTVPPPVAGGQGHATPCNATPIPPVSFSYQRMGTDAELWECDVMLFITRNP